MKDPAFDPDRFARYHYADILNRLPDSDGLAFWKNEIDKCDERPAQGRESCRDVKRQNVSAAFFLLLQYFGYLRREPDDVGFDGRPDPNFDGYNFWLNKLNSFGGNFVRAEMVRAFIISIEYQGRFGL